MPVTPLRTLTLACALVAATAHAQNPPAFRVKTARELDLGPVNVWAPKWSPDGQWIAFSLPKSEGIAVVKPDGSGLRILTSEPRSGYRFSWSPDSSAIAYRAAQPDHGPRRYVIRLVDLSGAAGEPSEIIPEAQPPQWQNGPDGLRWVTHDGKREFFGDWKSDRRGGRARPAVSPPLVATRNRELWLDSPDPARRRKLSPLPGIRPTWDTAGRHVLFDAADRIHIAASDDPGPARELCVGQHPSWSPDGEWIVFQITRDHSHAPEDDRQHTPDTLPHLHDDKTNHQIVDSDLWLIRRNGTARHQLTSTLEVLESDPDWSPDGRAIVCRDERTGRMRILELEQP